MGKMKGCLFVLAFLICFIYKCHAQKDPHWRHDRNTMIHLFEWKFRDIGDECERFLQHKGYGGVQLSPITENVIIEKRPWWEKYQPISYKIDNRAGNEEDFLYMSKKCNAVGIRIYVDAVINHMTAGTSIQKGTAGSTADPAKQSYPGVPYTKYDFNTPCEIKNYYNAEEVRNCQLSGLNDLNQGRPNVRKTMIEFLDHLVDLGVAGFAVDAVKHMWPEDLEYLYTHVKDLNTDFGFAPGSRPFIFQEVIDMPGDDQPITRDHYKHLGAITEFRHSINIGRVFQGRDKLHYLSNWGLGWGFLNDHDALTFIENHDNQRGHGAGGELILTYKQPKQYKMAIAFMLAHPYDGRTRILSGYHFDHKDQGPPQDRYGNIISPSFNEDDTCGNGWVCEHRWRQIYNMIIFRNVVKGTGMDRWWSNEDQQIAFARGNKGFVAFNNWGELNTMIHTNLPAGIYCDVISGTLGSNGQCTGKRVQVGHDGKALIQILSHEEDGVLAIHVNAKMS